MPEVASASVQLEAGRATVRWQAQPNLPAVMEAVKEAGFDARPLDEQNARRPGAETGRRWRAGGSMWWSGWPARCR